MIEYSEALRELVYKGLVNDISDSDWIITGKILGIESQGIVVDINISKPIYIPVQELSLIDINHPEEATELNQKREFLVTRDYDGFSSIYISYISSNTPDIELRLQEIGYEEILRKNNINITSENCIIHTKILQFHTKGVSVRYSWFINLPEYPPKISFSIKRLEIKTAWKRIRQLQSEDAKIYTKIIKKNSSGAIVKVEGLLGFVRTCVNKHKQTLALNQKLFLKIVEVDEEYNRLVLIDSSVLDRLKKLKMGQIVTGIIKHIRPYGLLIELEDCKALLLTHNNQNHHLNYLQGNLNINDSIRGKIVKLVDREGVLNLIILDWVE